MPPPPGDPFAQIQESARQGKLVVVVGTGFSLSVTERELPALGWKALVKDGFEECVRLGKIKPAQATTWQAQIDSDDLDDLLGAAEFMSKKLGAPDGDLYARWFKNAVGSARPTHDVTAEALRRVRDANVPISTLNYDHLLEQVTELPTITLRDTDRVTEFLRREFRGIFHLHGAYDQPATCVLGISDYASTLTNELRDLIQRALATLNRLLFIGCGATFADPNFRRLIPWLRKNLGANIPQHYTLVRQSETDAVAADPNCHGFVAPLAYGDDYGELPAFIERLFPAKPRKTRSAKAPTRSTPPRSDDILRGLRELVIRESGEMTIEGVGADADTARRRFDLERLFVPLQLVETDVLRTNPNTWAGNPPAPQSFTGVFARHRHLVILALPGGGKSLLLRRLAIAYADPERRRRLSDDLPDIDLTPVVIRCRDWRNHIDQPILALLDSMPSVTGRPELQGLGEALRPLLKRGEVLLLVDGLDEIHDNLRRSSFVEHLSRFLVEFSRTRVVVTSREAGFALVAPTLAASCATFRIAPLNEPAIRLLSGHWHTLMHDDSPQSHAEAKRVADDILASESLRRLAENPLLMTMLLVVKHGFGRLPPDRVTLYTRAVEILLNTWNTPGHAPLVPRETIPQLAYVAHQMLILGQSTATEDELLHLLEMARDQLPSVRRYARDTPLEFLQRVELRSSLLLAGGMQTEHGQSIPFYQFRHLTFQEYLAAIAVVEGYYPGYTNSETILNPLAPYLLSDQWKEVIPMAAVRAGRRAEPLIAALVARASEIQADAERGHFNPDDWRLVPRVLPPAVSRLLQCLVEQADAEPATTTAALRLIVYFAAGATLLDGFDALCRGPHGDELLRHALDMAAVPNWSPQTNLHMTCARIAAEQPARDHWTSADGLGELAKLLKSSDITTVKRALYACAGLLWGAGRPVHERDSLLALRGQLPLADIEHRLLQNDPQLSLPALLAWRLTAPPFITDKASTYTPTNILDTLLRIWLDAKHNTRVDESSAALYVRLGLPRGYWQPIISPTEIETIRQRLDDFDPSKSIVKGAAAVIAFHARVVPDEDLVRTIADEFGRRPSSHANAVAALRQLGPLGQRFALSLPEPVTVRVRKPPRS